MYERILVPLDGSGRAEHALPYAEWLARRLNSMVTLMTACPQNDPVVRPLTVYLEKKAEEMEKAGAKVDYVCVIGDIAEEILELSEKNRIGLIVMTSRGASGTSRWSLGGVALKVVLHSNTPILLVRTAERHAARLEEGVRSILVPLDGSPVAESILPHIQDLALATGLEVILLQVTVPIGYPSVGRDAADAEKHEKDVKKLNEARVAATQFYLSEREKELSAKGVKVKTVSLTGKPASEMILKYIEDNPIGLTGLATHGFSGISKWAFGSVAIDILEGSTRPLLLLRPPLPTVKG
ncbi:MAG: universal stress protein [Dehalococcoidia bacterium]|nr:universal stress protein [Dehalococcoidia bacterium]